MRIKLFLIALAAMTTSIHPKSFAQGKYIDRSSDVSFYSHTPIEDIEAKNSSALSVLDAQTGGVEFAVLIKAFQFEKALMQEHFNENYMESEKFPKATFKGQIKNLTDINFKQDGSYTASIAGTMTIHGVSKEIKSVATIVVKNSNISATSDFVVKPEDYNIQIPGIVKEKIAKEIKVSVSADFEAYAN